jgi:hypothetical protein
MEIHDLLILLQHEVQKSLTFIDETRGVKDPEVPAIHISLESVEIELPIVMSEAELVWDPKELKGQPSAVKRLKMPYTPEAAVTRGQIPRKEVAGRVVEAKIIGPIEKIDERTQKEYVGRIKVVLKPILK